MAEVPPRPKSQTQDRAEQLRLKKLQDLKSQEPDWLIDRFFVAGQPMLVGGAYKSLKTSLALDLAISLAAAKPFLGEDSPFPPPQRQYRVAIFSGESGEATLIETADRISKAKGLTAVPDNVLVCTTLPHFNHPDLADLKVVREEVRRHAADVVFFDPVYLCMPGINAASLYDVGTCLNKVTQLCIDVHCTPVLIHHTRKGAKPGRAPLQLSDLVSAGFAEFARQWLLVRRKAPFNLYGETAKHDLVVAYGGSAGHYGVLDVMVDEGRLVSAAPGHPASRRERWNVAVRRHEGATAAEVTTPKRTKERIKDEASSNHEKIKDGMVAELQTVQVGEVIGVSEMRRRLKAKGFKGANNEKKILKVASELQGVVQVLDPNKTAPWDSRRRS